MKDKTYHIFFSRLSNKLRINIVSSLIKKPKSVNELVKELNQEQSKVSHALKALSACKLVISTKKGKKRIYSINKIIKPIFKLIEKHEKECCKTCPCRCEK